MSNHAKSRSRTFGIAVAVVALSTIGATAAIWQSSSKPPARAIPTVGSVYQANVVVGFGSGAKFDPADRTLIEFSEIANAGRLDLRQPFEFEKYILKFARVYEVKDELSAGGPSATSPSSRRLVWVVAKIIGKRE